MPSSKNKIDTTSIKKEKVFSVAKLIQNKKAEDIVILDMEGFVNYTDYFLICSTSSTRTAKTIADTLLDQEAIKSKKVRYHTEGYEEGEWILIDLGDVIVHIFQPEKRAFYELERLWGDAPRLSYS